jgi:hypothetical protein
LVSFSACLFWVFRKATEFCVLISYSYSLLKCVSDLRVFCWAI